MRDRIDRLPRDHPERVLSRMHGKVFAVQTGFDTKEAIEPCVQEGMAQILREIGNELYELREGLGGEGGE